MSHRALITIAALTLLDFALWHWSLAGDRDLPALVSGVTLPPLLAALVWLTAVNLARLLARGARWPAAHLGVRSARAGQPRDTLPPDRGASLAAGAAPRPREQRASADPARRHKIAA